MFGKRCLCVLAVACSSTFFSHFAEAQRLPQGITPQHYKLSLAPDLKQKNFTGQESIDVTLERATKTVTLNAAEIQFGQVTANVGGKTLPALVSLDGAKEQATFTFPEELPAGPATLNVQYKGILNNELRGFYLSKTAKRNYAVTQFEPTDARRAFPSFDEPAYKATFDVSLTVDKGDTAISNTNVISDTPDASADKHTVTFATTPKMSTYLVAFLVGDFQCVSGQSEGVPIRSCATPDKVQLGKFAVSSAEYILHYYNEYFGIKYPMPKLDMIAIPDFEAGAMENFGAITYRETDLLIDEKTASVDNKTRVAIVVAHEMAHQWFGDMVTMQWWDNLWLNEGFATWMEAKPVDAWKAEWKMPESVAGTLDHTLNFDAQRKTRTIRATADTPDQINEMFDGISYGKAGAVLSMVENYLGKETFRQGVHNYLAAHMYGNATAEDFWTAQTQNSHKPVDKIMTSLVIQPGVPMLTFSAPKDGKVQVSQQRFFMSLQPPSVPAQQWTLPVCFKSSNGDAGCQILSEQQQALTVPASDVFFGNAGGKGYYRYLLAPESYEALLPQVEKSLNAEERISLLGNQWALMRAGKANIGSYLDLAKAVKGDQSSELMHQLQTSLDFASGRVAATKEEREKIASWVRKTFTPSLTALGDPVAGEDPEKTQVRAVLFRLVGELGKDPATVAKAKLLTEKYLNDIASVEPSLARAAVTVAAGSGDQVLYEKLLSVSQTSPIPAISSRALFSLTDFVEPGLVNRTLEYAVSGKVRNQDAIHLVSQLLADVETQQQAWEFIQHHWDLVKAQMTPMAGPGLIGSASSFCSADVRDQVVTFFNTHKVPAAERALSRMQDQINDCIELRKVQEPKLNDWLKSGF